MTVKSRRLRLASFVMLRRSAIETSDASIRSTVVTCRPVTVLMKVAWAAVPSRSRISQELSAMTVTGGRQLVPVIPH
jgi:hypothetical protein